MTSRHRALAIQLVTANIAARLEEQAIAQRRSSNADTTMALASRDIRSEVKNAELWTEVADELAQFVGTLCMANAELSGEQSPLEYWQGVVAELAELYGDFGD